MATQKNSEQYVKQAQSMHPELQLLAIRDVAVRGVPEQPSITLIILH